MSTSSENTLRLRRDDFEFQRVGHLFQFLIVITIFTLAR